MILYIQSKKFAETIDTPYNAIFGIIISIWATLFVESWKRNEKIILYYWDSKEKNQEKQDSRE